MRYSAEKSVIKLRFKIISVECENTAEDDAKMPVLAARSVESIVKIAKSFDDAENLSLRFANSRSPNTQTKIAPRESKIENGISVHVSKITASTVCFADEYGEDFTLLRNMQIIKSGADNAVFVERLSE